MITAKMLVYEDRIVWLEDVTKLRYVRERVDSYARRRRAGPSYWRRVLHPGRLVGYADLKPDAPNVGGLGGRGCFARRYFWVTEWDADSGQGPYLPTGAPVEAVDPLTVAPGLPGRMTPRAWGLADDEPQPADTRRNE